MVGKTQKKINILNKACLEGDYKSFDDLYSIESFRPDRFIRLACQGGNKDIVEMLVDDKCNEDYYDSDCEIDYGEDISSFLNIGLVGAVEGLHYHIIIYLLEHGAQINLIPSNIVIHIIDNYQLDNYHILGSRWLDYYNNRVKLLLDNVGLYKDINSMIVSL